ncbi:MAG: CCA tRNA nucleotidyltransferase [Methanothrix sp.]|uniref:CCA tRNA nucleotidyltransferase n=1 Tax=Methanothrix sp. TaxID=90426 RepID=UPI0015855A3B|nr:CCA tRNA nucleotidyltransferase [Methanothrix sp.]MBC7079538.1 CCA tRNA nucleotidyltransferase [Methanothrix sp.]NPU87510.1 CCA tRNA nucleotidyltransferase [Methanothrix sp.]
MKPSEEERGQLERISSDLLHRVEEIAAARNVACRGILVGSAARNTWLSGDRDIDIFIAVPEDGNLGDALEIAREIAPVHEERYAEHAYVHARIDGFDVDLVPCYDVRDPSKIKSAVDRTPFHSRYVSERIRGLEDEVLLLKQFMKGVGVYGSDLRTGGFSGYLAELLVIRYGSFLRVLEGASSWRPGTRINLAPGANIMAPLVVIDPVDPKRNVAAALTLDRMFQFVAAARCFLRSPDISFFFPLEAHTMSPDEIRAEIERRGTEFILLEIDAPDMVDDVLYPQMRKAEASIKNLLEREGFQVLRSDVDLVRGEDVRARLLFELSIWELPSVRIHIGPPVWEADHVSRFVKGHTSPLSGPYIDNGRLVVEIPRRYRKAVDLLEGEVHKISLGKHLSSGRIRTLSKREILEGVDESLAEFLTAYLNKRVRVC